MSSLNPIFPGLVSEFGGAPIERVGGGLTSSLPMLLEEAIYIILAGDASVTSLAGSRIYPSQIPQEQTQASLMYRQTDEDEDPTLDDPGVGGLVEVRYEVLVQAVGKGNYGTCKRLGEAVKLALINFLDGTVTDPNDDTRTFQIQKIFTSTTGDNIDDYEPTTKTYQTWRRFVVWAVKPVSF